MNAALDRDFVVRQFGALVVIVDLDNGGKSVTNDVEAVLKTVSSMIDLTECVIVYRDTDSQYDLIVRHRDGTFCTFYPLSKVRRVSDLFDVIEILKKNGELE